MKLADELSSPFFLLGHKQKPFLVPWPTLTCPPLVYFFVSFFLISSGELRVSVYLMDDFPHQEVWFQFMLSIYSALFSGISTEIV